MSPGGIRRAGLATGVPATDNAGIRYVAVDLGDKRTGIASGDSATGVVSPVGVIEVNILHGGGGPLLESVARAVEEHLGDNPRLSRGEVVVGMPLNMDGTEGPRARMVRAFAERLRTRTGRALHYQDERLTSAEADWAMSRTGMTHQQKKERRDALAAAAILRDFLVARRAAGDPGTDGTGEAGPGGW